MGWYTCLHSPGLQTPTLTPLNGLSLLAFILGAPEVSHSSLTASYCPLHSRFLKPVETVADFILGAPKSLQMGNAAMKLKDAYSLEGKL